MDIGVNRSSRQRTEDISCLSADLSSSICFWVCKGFDKLVSKHNKRVLAVFFLLLEAISFLLDVCGKSQKSVLLAAFILSAFGFVMTIFTFLIEKSIIATTPDAKRRLAAVEFSFSLVQLIATLLAVLGIKIIANYNSSILLLVFAIIAVVFIFKKVENGEFRRIITSWQKGDLLGMGSFGTNVYEGFTDDGFFFAVKEASLLDEGDQGKQTILQLQQEIALLSHLEHENIVQYIGTDKDDRRLYIFLELVAKGSLEQLYHRYRLSDSLVSAYTRQILSGLKYLHKQNVVHRDIRCAKILVDTSGSVKLADFGLAKAAMNNVELCRGSPFWIAPEVLLRRRYGLKADIWSLGCTVLEMLDGQRPYFPMDAMPALFRIGRGIPPKVPTSLSEDAQDFILKCLQVNPDERPTAAQLLDHPFVKRPQQTSGGPASPHYNSRQS